MTSETPTLRQIHVPTALVIGGSAVLLGSLGEAALSAQVLLTECAVSDSTNTAAQMRPLVMVLPEEVYAFDPEGFDALALDVQSMILRVNAEFLRSGDIAGRLSQLMAEAENRRAANEEPFD